MALVTRFLLFCRLEICEFSWRGTVLAAIDTSMIYGNCDAKSAQVDI